MNLFVPGRLCLFGEHSDWAGLFNRINSEVEPGMAIVTGIEHGIYANCERAELFRFRTIQENGKRTKWVEWPLSIKHLRAIAQEGGYYSYIAGVTAFMLECYDVGGVSIDVTEITLPLKKGLSSSAAICVLVARAFNLLYDLQISVRGEMEAAYRGEIMTPSRCGRLDQACAYGTKPVLMHFASENIDVDRLMVGKDLHWVFADLNGQKDTKIILSALNACYPYAQNEIAKSVQKALGPENRRICEQAVQAMRDGDAVRIGKLMDESQKIFDDMVAIACPSELASPLLHKIMEDEKVRALALGVKGVGSHGDGTVQMICEDSLKQIMLRDYLESKGMDAYMFTIRAQHSVRKAVIPVAGYGTRMFPATKVIKKELLPIIDKDGLAKPALLVLLDELERAGIEKIALIINPSDKPDFDRLFKRELTAAHYQKLPPELREMSVAIQRIGQKITYIYQEEQLGFGHAVYQACDFAGEDPVLMLLGDHVYASDNKLSCTEQLMDAFERTGVTTIALDEVKLDYVMHYGIVKGQFIDEAERIMQVTDMEEKPSKDYAQSYLSVQDKKGNDRYYCVFGAYVLTPKVFTMLESNIFQGRFENGEYGLTDVLNELSHLGGVMGYRVDGRRFDIGIPDVYRNTVINFPGLRSE